MPRMEIVVWRIALRDGKENAMNAWIEGSPGMQLYYCDPVLFVRHRQHHHVGKLGYGLPTARGHLIVEPK